MIAVSYFCNRLFGAMNAPSLPVLLLLMACTGLQARAQESISGAYERASSRFEMSDEVTARISASISERRQLKEASGPTVAKSAGSRQAILAARSRFDRIAAVSEYADGYTDTLPDNQYSFPEDTHDFCRAYFNDDTNSESIRQDYYLNMELMDGETLLIDLAWEAVTGGFADFDLYVFDAQGYPVGDADPAALLGGTNENEYQTDNTNLLETATAINTSGAPQPVLVVVDRFRSSSPAINSALTITVTGSDADNAFSVTEYIQPDQLTYVDEAGISQPLTEGISLTTNEAANFLASLSTDGCANSVGFTLVDDMGNPVLGPDITNNQPFDAFAEDGQVSLPPGTYTFTALPYSGEDGTGVTAEPQVVTFIVPVPETDPTWVELPADGASIPELTTYADTVLAVSSTGASISYSIAVDTLDAAALGISFENAIFTWTPRESLGQGTYGITFTADNGTSSVDSTITLVVEEVNLAPELALIPDQSGQPGEELTFTATASDADTLTNPIRLNELTFSLEGAETGMDIDPQTGVFTWAPADTGPFTVTVVVTDNGVPALSDSQLVNVSISSEVSGITIESFSLLDVINNVIVDTLVEGMFIDHTLMAQKLTEDRFDLVANLSGNIALLDSVAFTLSSDSVLVQLDPNSTVDLEYQPFETVISSDDATPYTVYQQAAHIGVGGTYTLSAVPFSAAITDPSALVGNSVTFTVLGPRVLDFILIDVGPLAPGSTQGSFGAGSSILAFTPIPENSVINVGPDPGIGTSNLNIRTRLADYPSPPNKVIESATFGFFKQQPNGTFTTVGNSSGGNGVVENLRPYSLFTDRDGGLDRETENDPGLAFNAWPPALLTDGLYKINAIPFSGDVGEGLQLGRRVGTREILFTIAGAGVAAPGQIDSALDSPTLLPNFPNPFNPATTIRFGIPETSPVKITVYDMLGRRVKVLVDGELNSGFHEVTFDASGLSSGIYLYWLETPAFVQVRRMTLLK